MCHFRNANMCKNKELHKRNVTVNHNLIGCYRDTDTCHETGNDVVLHTCNGIMETILLQYFEYAEEIKT